MLYYDDNVSTPSLFGLENEVVSFSHKKPLFFEYTTRPTLKYLHSGQIKYSVEGDLVTVNAGNIVLINGGNRVTTKIEKAASGLAIFFEGTLDDYAHDLLLNQSIPLIDSALKEQLTGISFDTDDNGEFLQNLKIGLLKHVEYLDSMVNTMNYKRPRTKLHVLLKVIHARSIIEALYTKKLSIDDLADMVAMSKYHLIRNFSNLFSNSPQHFLLLKRIELAKHLLDKKNISISEISSQCGFSSLFHFSKMFKKYAEHSPQKFRELKRTVRFQMRS